MMFRAVCLCAALLGVAPLVAQTAKPTAPATAKSEAKKTDEKKAEPKIEGITIPRANGALLGLKLEGGTFKLSFYDEKKKPVAADVTRAAARWNPSYKLGKERIILNLAPDGKSLVGAKPVRPPHVFKLYLTLLKGEPAGEGESAAAEQAVETFVVDFHT